MLRWASPRWPRLVAARRARDRRDRAGARRRAARPRRHGALGRRRERLAVARLAGRAGGADAAAAATRDGAPLAGARCAGGLSRAAPAPRSPSASGSGRWSPTSPPTARPRRCRTCRFLNPLDVGIGLALVATCSGCAASAASRRGRSALAAAAGFVWLNAMRRARLPSLRRRALPVRRLGRARSRCRPASRCSGPRSRWSRCGSPPRGRAAALGRRRGAARRRRAEAAARRSLGQRQRHAHRLVHRRRRADARHRLRRAAAGAGGAACATSEADRRSARRGSRHRGARRVAPSIALAEPAPYRYSAPIAVAAPRPSSRSRCRRRSTRTPSRPSCATCASSTRAASARRSRCSRRARRCTRRSRCARRRSIRCRRGRRRPASGRRRSTSSSKAIASACIATGPATAATRARPRESRRLARSTAAKPRAGDPPPQSLRLALVGPGRVLGRLPSRDQRRPAPVAAARGTGQLMALQSPAGALTQPVVPLPEAAAASCAWSGPTPPTRPRSPAPTCWSPSAISSPSTRRASSPSRRAPSPPAAARPTPASRRALHFDLGGALPLVDVDLRFAAGTHVAPVRLQGRSRDRRGLARPRRRRVLSPRARRRCRPGAGDRAARNGALPSRRARRARGRARRCAARSLVVHARARVARVRGPGRAAVPAARGLDRRARRRLAGRRRSCRSSTRSAPASVAPSSARSAPTRRSSALPSARRPRRAGGPCCSGACCWSASPVSARWSGASPRSGAGGAAAARLTSSPRNSPTGLSSSTRSQTDLATIRIGVPRIRPDGAPEPAEGEHADEDRERAHPAGPAGEPGREQVADRAWMPNELAPISRALSRLSNWMKPTIAEPPPTITAPTYGTRLVTPATTPQAPALSRPSAKNARPVGDADDDARRELHDEVALDLVADFVERLDGDLLLAQARPGELDHLAPEGVARGEQEERDEEDDRELAEEGEQAERAGPEVVAHVERRPLLDDGAAAPRRVERAAGRARGRPTALRPARSRWPPAAPCRSAIPTACGAAPSRPGAPSAPPAARSRSAPWRRPTRPRRPSRSRP